MLVRGITPGVYVGLQQQNYKAVLTVLVVGYILWIYTQVHSW